MRILISSHVFYPSIGGIEAISLALAQEFVRQGHNVKLVTQTPAADDKTFPFEVIRRPGARQLLSLVRWSQVYFQNNISLQTLWPLLIMRRPWVVAHQTWISSPTGPLNWKDYAKRLLIRSATSISVSQAIANHLSTPSAVIGNPYRDDLFCELSQTPRSQELIFLGRLVSDKGVDLLLEGVELLKQQGLTPKVTIVGTGPELANLRQLAKNLDLDDQVSFVGAKAGAELVQLLNAHQIMVIPSCWQEPFGVVALEGIACGCVTVGSAGGGLKDAIGPCGVTFPNGDVQALTQWLTNLLTRPDCLATYRENARAHLSRHTKAAVAQAYLKVIEDATQ